jgi:hypothetical protein
VFETKALYQNDPKWKNVKLGNQNQETIGTWGCLLTSLTMVANGFGYNETPETLNRKLKSVEGFQGALVKPAVLPNVCPGVRYKGYQPCENAPAPMAQVDAALAAGMPIIVQVDWSPKAGLQTHWVVLYGKEGDRYLMKDPYRYGGDSPDKKLYLTDRYKHSGKDPATAITGLVWFEGQSSGTSATPTEPPKPKPKVNVPADSFAVFGTADGLAFRSEPAISGALISRLPLSVKLISLEGGSSKKKVGVVNEWLHVQDPDGDQGYVAAWYLTLNEKEEEEKATAPVTGDKGFIISPTTDGLAFRRGPIVQSSTLIRRLPVSAKLIVLEPEEQARKKIGVPGQWLNVKDVTGVIGYIASWYVTPASEPALGVRTAEKSGKATEDDVLILQTTTDGVALRSETRVAPETLIKRMPHAAELVADDDDESKVGVYGQWIKVRDIEDDEGFVAAWYVTKR